MQEFDGVTTRRLSRRAVLRAGGLAGLGVAGAALIGCGSDDGDETATPSATSGATSAATASGGASASPTEAAAEQPAERAEFIVANAAEPPDLLPWFGGFEAALVSRQVYQTLIEPRLTLAEDGSPQWELVGVLAESWEREDDSTWLLHLRDGVQFHNGEPWNADAAVASYELMSNEELITELQKFNILGAITGFEKVDEMTVRVTSATPGTEPLTLNLRLGFAAVPASAVEGDAWRELAEHPIGTGPYQFSSWSRGNDIVLERFDGYWGGIEGLPRTVKYITRPEASVRALTVQTGESHFAYNVGAENAAQLEHWIAAGGFQSTSMRLNNTKPPFDDIRVRRAANHAIDRDAIVESIFRGAAKPAAFFAFQPVGDLEPFAYDPEMARSLLEEAGAGGTEVELVWGELRIPEEPQLAEVYKGYLDAVGFNVTLSRVERAVYGEASGAAFEDQPQMLIETTSSGNYGDVEGAFNDKYGCEGSGTFCEPEAEATWQGLGLLDFEERNAQVAASARLLHEEYTPRVWVAAVQQAHGLADWVDASGLPVNLYIRFEELKFA
jgi:peptide/nickel transport system substrate-binding protein